VTAFAAARAITAPLTVASKSRHGLRMQTKPRKSYRAPDAVRRSVRLCQDVHNRDRGKRTGAQKLAAYGYLHLAALFGMTEKDVRLEVGRGRLTFNLLASIVAYAAADPARLRRIVEQVDGRQPALLVDSARPARKPAARRRKAAAVVVP
jgi:hypothetical protein